MGSVGDWIYNALTGRLTADQLSAIQADTAAGVSRAGGTADQSAAAAAEIASFNQNYSGGTAETYVSSTLLPGIATGTVTAVFLVVVGYLVARKAGIL